MSKWLVLLLGLALGAVALLIWQQRKALAAVSGHKKTILDAADFVGSASTIWDDIKGEFKK